MTPRQAFSNRAIGIGDRRVSSADAPDDPSVEALEMELTMRLNLVALIICTLVGSIGFAGAAHAQNDPVYSNGKIHCPDGQAISASAEGGAPADPTPGTMRMICEMNAVGNSRDKVVLYPSANGGGVLICPGGKVLQLSREQVEASEGRLSEVCHAVGATAVAEPVDPNDRIRPMSQEEVAARFASSLTGGRVTPAPVPNVTTPTEPQKAEPEPQKAETSGSDVLWTAIIAVLILGVGGAVARLGKRNDVVFLGVAAAVFAEVNARYFGRVALPMPLLAFAPIAANVGWAALGAPSSLPASAGWLVRGAVLGVIAFFAGAAALAGVHHLPLISEALHWADGLLEGLYLWSMSGAIVKGLPLFLQPRILVFVFAAALDFFFFYIIAAAISGMLKRAT